MYFYSKYFFLFQLRLRLRCCRSDPDPERPGLDNWRGKIYGSGSDFIFLTSYTNAHASHQLEHQSVHMVLILDGNSEKGAQSRLFDLFKAFD